MKPAVAYATVSIQSITMKTKKCKWCGATFKTTPPKHNQLYCSDYCKQEALKESKRKYFHKRRLQILNGHLKTNELVKLGNTYLSKTRHEDDDKELQSIRAEMRRLGLKPY